jgi:hypothetical protein
MNQAVQILAEIEGRAAYDRATKRHLMARTYPADNTAAHAARRYRAPVALEVAA